MVEDYEILLRDGTEENTLELCEVDYYGMTEEPIHLACSWGAWENRWENRNENTYQVDVDEDGIKELICNVQWLIGGAMDAIIYYWDGEKIYQAYGTDLLVQEEDYEIGKVGSVGAEYLPDKNKIRAWYWKEELQDFVEKEYEIELEKLEMWEFQ